ncbi:MAG: transposase [Pseudomonadota bacterium]|nr:transposase [Pseudomonadota bacterium]
MARLPRFVLPGYPQHVIQRGNNRQRILIDETDYWFLWEKLLAAAAKFGCDLHAYVLMPNHFHLLLTPWEEDGIGKLMQYVGRYYVQHFNRRYDRTGTLWEGRYRATLLDPNAYLLVCSRYVELNPVRAGFVGEPATYAWSSYGRNAEGKEDALVTPHPEYNKLGRSQRTRQSAYRETFDQPIDDSLLERIRNATNKAWVLGDEAFCREMERRLNRRTSPRSRGGDRRSAAYRKAAAQRG